MRNLLQEIRNLLRNYKTLELSQSSTISRFPASIILLPLILLENNLNIYHIIYTVYICQTVLQIFLFFKLRLLLLTKLLQKTSSLHLHHHYHLNCCHHHRGHHHHDGHRDQHSDCEKLMRTGRRCTFSDLTL